MCIIAYKPMGKQLPSKTKIKTMFKNNPDGAGFMYADGERVYIVKGLMNLSDFNRELNKIRDRAEELPIVMHFRITTHGGTVRGLTHPFPLSADPKELQNTRTEAACGIAHNGIIPLTSYASKLSDTAEFISRYMVKLIDPEHVDADMLTVCEELAQSKLCILTAAQDVHLLGDFTQDGNGLYYSNESYKTPKKRKYSFSKYAPYKYSAGSLYPDCNGRQCATCADECYCYGVYSVGNPHDFSQTAVYNECDGFCELCKHEQFCLDKWSDGNPYNPKVYNAK